MSVVSGNGTGHSSKYLLGSKSSSLASRSLNIRKGQLCANEIADEGDITFCTCFIQSIMLMFEAWSPCFGKMFQILNLYYVK